MRGFPLLWHQRNIDASMETEAERRFEQNANVLTFLPEYIETGD